MGRHGAKHDDGLTYTAIRLTDNPAVHGICRRTLMQYWWVEPAPLLKRARKNKADLHCFPRHITPINNHTPQVLSARLRQERSSSRGSSSFSLSLNNLTTSSNNNFQTSPNLCEREDKAVAAGDQRLGGQRLTLSRAVVLGQWISID